MISLLKKPLSICQFDSQVEGKFETYFLQFVVSVGGQEQGYQCCFGDVINQGYV